MRSRSPLLLLGVAVIIATCGEIEYGDTEDGTEDVERTDSAALACVPDVTLVDPDPRTAGLFGASVAIVGDQLFVGSIGNGGNGAAVHAYGSSGAFVNTLSGSPSSQFGLDLASAGSNLAVLAPFDDVNGDTILDGAAYVFDPSGSVLTVATGGALNIGRRIASDGDHLFIGDPWATVGGFSGAGRVREVDASGNVVRFFTAPTPAAQRYYGYSVAIGGPYLFVGVPHNIGAGVGPQVAGQVHVYNRSTAQLIRTFSAPSPNVNDHFGWALAAQGEDVVVAAASLLHRFNGPTGVLRWSASLSPISQESRVAWSGKYIVVGMPTFNSNMGRAFVVDSSGSTLFSLQPAVTQSSEYVGISVAIDATKVVVGGQYRDAGATDAAGAAYIFGINRPPSVNNATRTTRKNEAAIITPGKSDVNQDPLTLIPTIGPFHGAVAVTGGNLHYTPEPDFVGPDSISYVVNDGCSNSPERSVAITVRANTAPVAGNVFATTNEETGVLVHLDAVDPEADAITYSVVSAPAHGVLTGTAPDLTFTPATNYTGADSFTYKATDGLLESATVTASLTINNVNDAPTAVADGFTVDEDVPLVVAAGGVLANDTDIDSGSLTALLVAQPVHGSLSLAADGSFTYTPSANYNGVDSFTYRARDGALNSSIVTVTITISPLDDAPVAAVDSFLLAEDAVLSLTAANGVLANDTDVDGGTLSATLDNAPSHGTVSLAVDGSLEYVPSTNYHGADSFTYSTEDPSGLSSTATVTLGITSVDDAPTVPVQVAPGAGAAVLESDLLEWSVSTDVDGDAIAYYRVEILESDAVIRTVDVPGTLSATVGDIGPGSYAWRVQAIDATGTRSGFSANRPFRIRDGGSQADPIGCTLAGMSGSRGHSAATLLAIAGAVALLRRRTASGDR